jgi:hypothetical protein
MLINSIFDRRCSCDLGLDYDQSREKKTGLNDEEAVGRWLSRAQLVPVAQNVQVDNGSWRCRFSYF